MTHNINLELSLGETTRWAADQARVLTLHRHLLLVCPPAAGPLNRIAHCIGTELCVPGERQPLLIRAWAASREALRRAETEYDLNHPGYLVAALHAVMSPLAVALGLRVSAQDGEVWLPERSPVWDAWRAHHPGALDVVIEPAPDGDPRRQALERWALGPRFLHDIEPTSQWPNVVTTA